MPQGSLTVPQRLGTFAPIVGLAPIALAEANGLLDTWGHYLGPVNRPFRSEAWALDVAGHPVAVAVSCSIVSETISRWEPNDQGKLEKVETWRKDEVVELARLCASERVWTRVMLRLWREVCAPRWQCPGERAGLAPLVAAAYSQNSRHDGTIYRFDGWERQSTTAGSSGGGAWSRKRDASDAVHGSKTLWLWRFGV